MVQLLCVFVGGGLGALLRWWISGWVAERVGETFPWGTLVVNVTGCIAVGFLAGLFAPEGRWWATPEVRQFLILGVCGGYTTFSSFSLQTLNLLLDGQWLAGLANVGLSVVLCMVGVWLGHWLGLWTQTFRS
jgi:CrcB protein